MFDPLRAKARVITFASGAFALGVLFASGLGWTRVSLALPSLEEAPQVSRESVQPALDLSQSYVNVADVVTPAVVRIEATRRPSANQQQEIPEALQRFFGPGQPDSRPRTAGGSGFIVSPEGYVLTNDHVVSDASEVRVYFADRRYFNATVVGSDPFTDVAVLKIEPSTASERFSTLSLGDSEEVRVGQWVLAIGNPGFGSGSQLDYTVTAGIVSARGRGLGLIQNELRSELSDPALSGYAIEDFIQTDAVINPGNSGGPLVDMEGRVVGINSAIYSPTGYYQGYGFAIPVNLARRIMEDLIEYGQVRRARLGVQITEVAPEDAEAFGLPSVSGVLIQGVDEGTPGFEAGLKQGDVIVALDDQPVGYVAQLQGRVAMYRPGDDVTLKVYRDGREREIDVRLAEAPINDLPTEIAEVAPVAEERLGFSVQELTADLAEQYGYEDTDGVVISRVAPASPAQRRQMIRGERVLEINGTPIATAEDVRRELSAVESGGVVTFILGNPDGGSRIVNVKMP